MLSREAIIQYMTHSLLAKTTNLHLQITEGGERRERPADKDWPFLLNLGRNFFSSNPRSPETRLGEEKGKDRPRQEAERERGREREREREWGGSQRQKQREEQMRRATPPWFQWKQVNKSKQAAQKLALMAVECGWSYLPVCVHLRLQHNDAYCPAVDNRAEARGSDVMLHFIDPRGCNVNPQQIACPQTWESRHGKKKDIKHLNWISTDTHLDQTYSLLRLREQMMLLSTEHPVVSPCLDACGTEGRAWCCEDLR